MSMIFKNIIDEQLPGWSGKEYNGKSFDSILQIDGIPLWWFYSRLVTGHVLPKQFDLQDRLKQADSRGAKDAYYRLLLMFLQKALRFNESRKFSAARIKTMDSSESGAKALFLTYTNHFNRESKTTYRIQKIVDCLRQEPGLKPLVIFADPLSNRKPLSNDLPGDTIYGYIDESINRQAKAMAKDLHHAWKRAPHNEIFSSLWRKIRETMNFFFSEDFIYLTALYYLVSKKVISEEKIKVIVLTSRNGLHEKCVMAAAHTLDIPVVILQHGLGIGVEDQETFTGTKFAVFGEFFRKRLTRWGVPEDDIFITGPIIFDEIVPFIRDPRKLGKVVLFTAPFIENGWTSKEKYFADMEQILKSLKGISKELIIKLHPREKELQTYKDQVDKVGIQNTTVIAGVGSSLVYETMHDAELVINFFSTVALEAMIMDIPVLTLDLVPGIVDDLENTPYSGGIIKSMDVDLKKTIEIALQDSPELQQKRQEKVKEFCSVIDGKASQRVVDLLLKITDAGKEKEMRI